MESEMYEGSWSCMHNNRIRFITDNDFKNFKENASDMLLNLRMDGRKG
jgi:hypothetical protein